MLKARANRFIWAINGWLLFALLLVALGHEVGQNVLPMFRAEHARGMVVGQPAEVARAMNVAIQHLEYDRPERVGSSNYFAAAVYVMDKKMPREVREAIERAGDISPGLVGALINVLFFDAGRSDVRRLLPHNAYIDHMDSPSPPRGQAGRPHEREFIIYRIAMRDTNGDNRINDRDEMVYYISDLGGRGLRQITPDGLELGHYWFSEDFSEIFFEKVMVDETELVPGHDYFLKERRVHFYDMRTGRFESFDALQEEFRKVEAEFLAGR
jgi:hypothetical protein